MKSSWEILREYIEAGRNAEALEVLQRCAEMATIQHNSLASFVGMSLNRLARFDEAELEKLFRERYGPQAQAWIASTPGARESVEKFAGLMENPGSEINITEDAEKYILTLDPCRTGGRLRRGGAVGPTAAAGFKIGTTGKPYPWCWGKPGVSYYCIHDCLFLEILPIELRGYPIAVVNYAERAEDPCILYFYKRPELIPEQYFLRLGKKKAAI